MKTLYYSIITSITAGIILLSCQKIEYDGHYSKEGFYDANNSIYFYFPQQSDTLVHYSFGTDWVAHTRQEIKIPVKVTGFAVSTPRTFKVSIDEKASTAVPNKHFTPLPEQFQIPADSLTAFVTVEMWRDNLSSEKKDSIALVLQLENSEDLKVSFEENRKVTITVDDFLEQPYFWIYYEYYWGPYSAIKYRKFLEYYDGEPKNLEAALMEGDFIGVSLNFLKVYNFFKEHPEYEQILPDNPYNPYK